MERVSQSLCFGGSQGVYTHQSAETGTPMTFQVYLPAHARGDRLPVLWWLSGLTCTHENAMIKCHYHRACAEHGVALIGPAGENLNLMAGVANERGRLAAEPRGHREVGEQVDHDDGVRLPGQPAEVVGRWRPGARKRFLAVR